MKLTDEQQKILDDVVNGKENIVISAFAGTGKTTLLEQIIKEPKLKNKKKLYLVFNKKNANEAKQRFSKYKNVDVFTTHAIAYKYIVSKNKLERPINYNIVSFKSFFNVNFEKAKNLFHNYKKWVFSDKGLKEFFYNDDKPKSNFHKFCYNNIKKLIIDVIGAKYSCSHDLYLKLFEMMLKQTDNIDDYLINHFKNDYDMILIDEAQDTNEVVLSIFKNVTAKQKIVVGDIHQQIYSFRGSVNALEKLKNSDEDVYYMTQSFRYGNNIANYATNFLHTFKNEKNTIKGVEKPKRNNLKCVITRTNAKIIEYALRAKKKDIILKTVKDVNEIFELPLNVYYFKIGETKKITKTFQHYVKEFKTYENLYAKCDMIDDVSLTRAIELIESIGGKIFVAKQYIEKCNQIKTDDFYYISNAHISKGLEFDEVVIANDYYFVYAFIKILMENIFDNIDYNEILIDNLYELDNTIIKMILIKANSRLGTGIKIDLENISDQKLVDEMNLFYVAITRAKLKLIFENRNMKIFINQKDDVLLLIENLIVVAFDLIQKNLNAIKKHYIDRRFKNMEKTQENVQIVFNMFVNDFQKLLEKAIMYAIGKIKLNIVDEKGFKIYFDEYIQEKFIN